MVDASGQSVVSQDAARAERAGHVATDALTVEAWRLACQKEQGEVAVAHCERAFAQVARTEDRALECSALTWLARARALLGQCDVATVLLQHAQVPADRGSVGTPMVHARR